METLAIVQSTAVIIFEAKFGNMQALPAGSGNLEIKISPLNTSSQCNALKVSFDIHFLLLGLSRYSATPTLPVCIKRTPELLWSFASIQSPSVNLSHSDDNLRCSQVIVLFS